jgi:hydrogenase maturation factor
LKKNQELKKYIYIHKSGAMKNVDEEKAMDGNNGESL